MKKLEVGDVVIPRGNFVFASGCGRYTHAIVISTEPLVFVSEATDMRWSCVDAEDVKPIGTAYPSQLELCMRRSSNTGGINNKQPQP